jgi:hypothetical protein
MSFKNGFSRFASPQMAVGWLARSQVLLTIFGCLLKLQMNDCWINQKLNDFAPTGFCTGQFLDCT